MVIITRNIAINIYNAKKKEAIIYDYGELKEMPDDAMLPIDILINDERIQNIKAALSSLDSKYSDIILMKYYSDYTNSEIASLFNISEDLVSVRLLRGKKLLLNKLKEGELK
jgi:RNA polymerase sigma-70 factor (ECF subfamily)